MNTARLLSSAALLGRAPAPPQRRTQQLAPRPPAPGRRCARRLAAPGRSRSGGDYGLPPFPAVPDLVGTSASEACKLVDRFWAEADVYWDAWFRREARARARKAAPPSHSPPAAPSASLAAAWPPVTDSTLPAAREARAGAAEAAATAAVAFAGTAVGHEAAAIAAHAAAATQPASALGAAGAEWLRASTAWRQAFESLEAAQHAAPGSEVVQEAAAQVEAARRFTHQMHGLSSGAAEDAP